MRRGAKARPSWFNCPCEATGSDKVQQVTAALIAKEGKILLALRRAGKHMGQRWELPGGKVDPGENPKQALSRELQEEFDIRVRVGEYLGSIRFQADRLDLQVRLYRVTHVAGEFDLREHEELRWVDPEQLEAYDLVDSDRQVIRNFRARLI
jgi:mutator protein MutT